MPSSVLGFSLAARSLNLYSNLLKREMRARYLGSAAGAAWVVLHPFVLLIVYHFVFTRVFRARTSGAESFLAFVAVALWPWLAVQESIQRGVTSLGSYSSLIRKVAFQHEIVIYASVSATLLLQFAGYVVVLAALVIYGEPLHISGLLFAVPLWLIMALGVVGVTLFFSALQVFMRDVEHMLMPLLMILMYLTPILYPLSLVPESMRGWVALNPFSWFVGRLRESLIDGNTSLPWSDGVAFLCSATFFIAGLWVFRRLSPHFEDFI